VRPHRHVVVPTAAAALVLTVVGLAILPAAPARAADPTAQSVVIAGSIGTNGVLTMQETITFAAGSAPAQLVQTLGTTRSTVDYRYYQFTIANIQASANGADLGATVSAGKNYQVVTVDTAKAAGAPIVISYEVTGVAAAGGVAEDGTAITSVSWPVVEGLNVAVQDVSGEVRTPGPTRSVDCQSGVVGGLQPCQMWASGTHDSPNPSFSDQGLPVGGQVVMSFTLPSSLVSVNQDLRDQWTLGRAFSASPLPLGIALGVLALGALLLWALWRSMGREDDPSIAPTTIASFVPVGPGESHFQVDEDIRPGHIGTVVDEHVDPVDVTATLLDLAMRGHVQITELPPSGPRAGLDWTLKRLSSTGELAPFEKTLLDAVAPADGEAVPVSKIGAPVAAVIPTIQDQLYEDVTARGWFAHRPDQVRSRWHLVGWIVLALAAIALILLVIFTRFGLLGLALIALAVALLWLAHTMPRRTPAGVGILRGLHVLSTTLQTHPTDQVAKANAHAEISSVLPYTVVLGGRERWLQALAAADDDPAVPDPDDLTWYAAPSGWSMAEMPAAFDAFITAVQGRLFARD